MKRIKMYFILLVLLFMYVTICAVSYVNAVSSNISSEVFRLHVVANSDSKEDQDLKYIVRDNVLAYVNSKSSEFISKSDLINFINLNMSEIEKIAKDTVTQNGFSYNVSVEIGNFEFPTKQYGDISLPSGNYDSLRIKLGDYEGQNWWCVMFPPLCFVDVTSGIVDDTSKKLLENNLDEEEYALVSENTAPFQFKFKLLEFFNNFNLVLANK